MVRKREGFLTGLMALAMYLVMVGTNALANILPINGITTGEVSDNIPNLFAPAGITFSIWGVIYVLLGVYSVYVLVYINRGYRDSFSLKRVNQFYILSSIANSVWIYNWHHGNIGLTLVLMLVILASLIVIVLTLRSMTTTGDRMLWARLPFSVYFGWITIATIANITAFLVDMGWDGFGIPENIWTVAVLAVGLLIGGTTIWRLQDKAYGAVMVWAYMGILLKHISQDGFDGRYPAVIVTTGISIGIFISIIFLASRRKKYMFNVNSGF
ncbi:hypothetical protein [Gudongella sp. SC589]|jgi:hypothetical protein|uniref:hypothetical protein n=1 Tax=Gudongella sp. SC589 TaxID=3385990 RepID=UPI003904BA92